MKLTRKQQSIMNVVMDGNQNDDGVTVSWCDVEEIMHRTKHTASRPAMLCSLSILEKKGLIERKVRGVLRRGRRRTVYIPTNYAFDRLKLDLDLAEEIDQLENLISN